MSNRRKQLRRPSASKPGKETPREKRQHSANKGFHKNAGDDNKNEIIPANDKPAVIVIMEVIGTVVGGAFGSLFGSSSHIIACIWCVWIAALSGLGLIYYFIGKSKPEWTSFLRLSCGTVFIGVTVWFSLWSYAILHRPLENKELFQPPNIAMELGPNLNPKDPFGQTFIVRNQGQQAISNVWEVLYWSDTNIAEKAVALVFTRNATQRMTRDMKQSVHFAEMKHPPVFDPKTWVNFDVRYTPDSSVTEMSEIFQFCVVKDDAGNYLWMYDGEGESLASIHARLARQPVSPEGPSSEGRRFIDDMAVLYPKIDALRQIDPKSNDGYCLNLVFSTDNAGSLAAKEFKYNWGVFDPAKNMFFVPSNNLIFNGLSILPQKTLCVTQQFDGPFCTLYDGLEDGKLAWIGSLDYKDERDREYNMTVRAFRTNGQFEVRILGKGGYFDEIDNQIYNLQSATEKTHANGNPN